MDGDLLNFKDWLNSNNVFSLEGIPTLQKSLFLHTLLCVSSFVRSELFLDEFKKTFFRDFLF